MLRKQTALVNELHYIHRNRPFGKRTTCERIGKRTLGKQTLGKRTCTEVIGK